MIADDILVYGEGDTEQEALENHNKNLEAVLSRCKEKNIKLNKEKAQICKKKLKYMGNILTAEGISADPAKTAAIE